MNTARICVFALLATTPFGRAQTPAPRDDSNLPPHAAMIEGVLVPVPSEIFNTLDRFAHSNWRAVQRTELPRWKPHGDQAEIALLLGVVIAEGFIAVEAEDAVETKNIGQAALKLASGLGVERAVIPRSRSIAEHAEKGDWPGVRQDWDAVLSDVEQGMHEIKSEQFAQLVSLGGWLRGAQALTALVLQDYSGKDAALLRQPALLEYFEKQLAGMDHELRARPALVRLHAGLQKIATLLVSDDAQVSKETVEKLSALSEELIKGFRRGG